MQFHTINKNAQELLGYNPAYELIHAEAVSDHVMVTCHGSGANKEIGHYVAKQVKIPIVTFNFPDHDIDEHFDIHTSSFGTINEYLPLIFLLKDLISQGIKKISIYGFSAGGGATINTLTILNTFAYQKELSAIGVSEQDAQDILKAVSEGFIILDAPLKSATEILSIRPNDEFIQIHAKRYKNNNFEPIDRLNMLKGLSLSIILYFEKPDEILANRDDELYYQKLKEANSLGTTHLITGHDGGHNGFHKKLWAGVTSLCI